MKCCNCKKIIKLYRIFKGCRCEACKSIYDYRKNNTQDIHWQQSPKELVINTYNDYALKAWLEGIGNNSILYDENSVAEIVIGANTFYLHDLQYIDVGYIKGVKSYQDDNKIFYRSPQNEFVFIPVDNPIKITVFNRGYKFQPSEKYKPNERPKYKAVTIEKDGSITGHGGYLYSNKKVENFELPTIDISQGIPVGQELYLKDYFYNYCYNIYDIITTFDHDYIRNKVVGNCRQYLLYRVETKYYHYDFDEEYGASMGMVFIDEVSPKEIMEQIKKDDKQKELEAYWKNNNYTDYDTILDRYEKMFC